MDFRLESMCNLEIRNLNHLANKEEWRSDIKRLSRSEQSVSSRGQKLTIIPANTRRANFVVNGGREGKERSCLTVKQLIEAILLMKDKEIPTLDDIPS